MELRYRQAEHEKGFTLLESLIALVVFSIALLALAAMYTKTLSMSHSSFLRALASMQAMDLEERIRANPNAAFNAYTINCSDFTAADVLEPNAFNGDAAHVASQDAKDWCGNNWVVFGSLLQVASVNVANYASAASGTAPADIVIGIKWNERALGADNDVSVQSETFTYMVRK